MSSGKKVLIVGANSFIGQHLVARLKDRSNVVGAYHVNREKLSGDILNVPIGDLSQLNTDFDDVYILSAFIPGSIVDENGRIKLFESNIKLTATICNLFNKSRIIYASTVSVYKPKNGEICENDDEGGLNEYGISKLWGESIVRKLPDFSIVRFSSVFGVNMKTDTIIPNYIKQALEKKVITVWGNGGRQQNYIHVSDVAQFLEKAALSGKNDIFLATSDSSISNLQLATIVSQKTGCGISYQGVDKSPSFHYNNKYTAAQLGYNASVKIEQGLTELIEWIKGKY